jgi:hypothetical protein
MDEFARREDAPLLQEEKMSTDLVTNDAENFGKTPVKYLWINRVFLLVIAICTLVDVVAICSIAIHYTMGQHNIKVLIIDELEIGKQYVNLEALYREAPFLAPHYDPIINVGHGVGQVSLVDPSALIPQYTEFRNYSLGNVPIFQRRLLLTPAVSTIAQFLVMDFGMENCSLAITVPEETNTRDTVASSEGKFAVVDIHQIEVKKRLDLRALSRSRLPPERKYVGSLLVSYGKTAETSVFHCDSRSYQTFEITCQTPDCHIDVMGMDLGESGVYLRQYQTI